MAKIRIYELARELGVENKVILAKTQELGIPGKSSHSHSLDASEADSVRRAILRQTIGASAPKETETVTTKVDKDTGATITVVEKRSGNVIRRRRSVNAAPSAAASKESTEKPVATPDAKQPEVASDESVARDVDSEQASGLMAAEAAVAGDAQPAAQLAESTSDAVDTSAASAANAVEIQPEAKPADVALKQAESSTSNATPNSAAESEPEPSTVGPKILGKIELPQKRAARTTEPRPVQGRVGRAAPKPVDFDEEDGKSRRKGASRKGRRREFSSTDLVDYSGRTGRRRKDRGKVAGGRGQDMPEAERPKLTKRVIELGDSITVGELAKQMSLKSGEVIAKLLGLGVMATINHAIDKETAQIVADELGYEVKHVEFKEEDLIKDEAEDEGAVLVTRPPVVTVMGHVDHGKTSLLDQIRNASVVAKEAGGITQHIGAYSVETSGGGTISFIDTPGHAAFTAMRARGANVTDIVILVVAADDGVMPQTREAINHAQAAKVPIVVAVNKMDRPDANPDKIRTQLAEFGLQPEDWGGDTMFFPVSALKGDGITELLEGILLIAEVEDFKANPDRRAKGSIIESRQDRGRGVVATVLVQAGTLRVGDVFVAGSEFGRVRTMTDHLGQALKEAGPSTPVEITGLNGMPESGDDFVVMGSDSDAREVASNRTQRREQQQRALASGPISLEEFAKRASNEAAAELNVILKADVQGSVEAVKQSIEKLSGEKVTVRVLHAAVGGITESDVQLAVASSAIIVGFGVRGEPRALADADRSGIQIRFYRVIYELLDDVKNAMVGLLDPIHEESNLGRVEVRETFTIPKIGTIAGCYVTGGMIRRNAQARLLRDSRIIHEGKMSSLRRFKDDVKEVQAGFECGIGLEGYNDVKIGDVIEVFELKEVAPTLD
jgi:translation initiation factor IF-2